MNMILNNIRILPNSKSSIYSKFLNFFCVKFAVYHWLSVYSIITNYLTLKTKNNQSAMGCLSCICLFDELYSTAAATDTFCSHFIW